LPNRPRRRKLARRIQQKDEGMRNGVLIIAAALTTAPVAARADVTVTSETVTAKGDAGPRTIYMTADQAKMDTPKMAIIFQIATGKATAIMKEKKEYMELDVKAIGAAASGVAALMKDKLASMPEAQRKMVEAMMGKRVASLDAPKIQMAYEKSGDSKTIGAWSCDVYHQKKDGKLLADLCIAKADAVGLTAEDLKPLRALAATMVKSLPEGIRNNAAVMDFDEQTKQIGFTGIPVEAIIYAKGMVVSTTTVKSVDHAAIGADAFAIPAGYARKEMPGLAALSLLGRSK
jgi:hypothetical protein